MKRSPPVARAVAHRAVALYFVSLNAISLQPNWIVRRWRARMRPAQWRALSASSRAIQQSTLRELIPWKSAFSPREWAFMTARSSLWIPDREQIDMSWRNESLAVIAWALRSLDKLPSPGRPVRRELLVADFVDHSRRTRLMRAPLRSRREIERARDLAESHYRRSCARHTTKADELRALRWDHIGFDDEWSAAKTIAHERLYALNWLCGRAPRNRWDETPTDT